MIELWYSNRLEDLVDALALTMVEGLELWYSGKFGSPGDALAALGSEASLAGRRDPFETTHVVVPNWNLKRYLQLEVARRLGAVANLEFHRLRKFLADAAPEEDAGRRVEVLDQATLQSALFEMLADREFLAADVLEPVRQYIEPEGLDGTAEEVAQSRIVRRFQLSQRLAEIFQNYAFSRPRMIERWPRETTMGKPPIDAPERYRFVERWQRHIWLALFGEGGFLERESPDEVVYRTLPQLYASETTGPSALPGRVHVFGLSYVASVYGPILERAARESEIYLYSLNPCGEFWEDLHTGRRDEEEYLFSPEPVDAGRLGRHEPGEFWVPEKENPPLRLWGRPGRDHVRLLGQLVERQPHQAFRDPLGEEQTLLHHVQKDIYERRPEDTDHVRDVMGQQSLQDAMSRNERRRPTGEVEADESIRFFPCTGIQREIEVVARRIWERVTEGEADEAEGLDFNDIAVIVNPHKREEYVAQIASVFERVRDIPYNVVDLPASSTGGVVEAVEMLLELPFGDFPRSELLRFLTHPNVAGQFPDVDTDDWIDWCDRLNIYRGADRGDLEETYVEGDVFNWDQGLRRLVLGAFMGEGELDETRAVPFDGEEYYPEEISPQRVESAARFATLTRSLISDVRYLREADFSLAGWAEILAEWLDTYIEPTSDGEDSTLLRCRQRLRELADRDLTGRTMPYRAAYEFAAAEIGELEVRRGQYLADGVVVSSFLPMRPIPFRDVYVVGMGEETFPSSDPNTPLDLRTAYWQPGDVGPRDQDRYMFLETLISTRDRMHLSWVARDPSTGEELEPSSIVRELQSVVALFDVDPEALEEPQPLRRYDRESYFGEVLAEGSSGARAALPALGVEVADAEAFREAKLAALREELAELCGERSVAFPEVETLEAVLEAGEYDRLAELLGLPEIPEADEEEAPVGPVAGGSTARLQLHISQLRSFLESPLQGAAKARLRMREIEAEDPINVEREPFDVDHLNRAIILRDVFNSALVEGLGEVDLERAYAERVRRASQKGALPVGPFLAASAEVHRRILDRWRSNLALLGVETDRPMGRYRLGRSQGAASESLPALVLQVDLPTDRGVEPHRVEIHGATEAVADGGGEIVTLGMSSKAKPRYFLRGLLSHVVLTAAGELDEGAERRLIVDPNKRHTGRTKKEDCFRTLPGLGRREAVEWLGGLVEELFTGVHDYLMPIEMVDKYVGADDGPGGPEAFARLVRRDLNGWRTSGSYKYGPIDDIRAFEPPADPDELIARRFGVFYGEVG